ncbi:MAG: hypothetical protein EOO05_07965 [Chitinophagaceae bacterium]|nr:MAG: hypothetical protein EOO05_07965 [Chitinophagaceae bacterium]
MIDFLAGLRSRNEPLFYFGLICLLSAVCVLLIARFSHIEINGVNSWYKPFKFALSIGIFSWTMGWYTGYLEQPTQVSIYSWTTILLLGFELFYITFQAARGQLSHYNVSSPIYTSLTVAMAVAAIAATLYTGYIGILFCTGEFPQLPGHYLWAIRIGIFLFVIFAFEGAIMGGNGSHSVGGSGDGNGLPILNWSRKYGDLRIAHFVGMHALQVLPLMAYYLIKDTKLVIFLGLVYGALAIFCLIQALNSRPLLSFS